MSQGQIIPTHVLTLTDYMRTAQGKALLSARVLFVYEGRLWGSHRGRLARTYASLLMPNELEDALDIDGTKPRLMALLDSKRTQVEHEVRMDKARRQTAAANELATLRKTAKSQFDEFGETDPELLLTITQAEERLRFKVTAGSRPPEPEAPKPGTPEFLAQFVPHPELHPELVKVPGLNKEPPTVGLGESPDEPKEAATTSDIPGVAVVETNDTVSDFEQRMERMETMVSRLCDVVLSEPGGSPEVTGPAATVVETNPVVPDAPRERVILPSETCKVCAPHKSSPEGHHNPKMWLRGHNMSKHAPRKKKPAA